jgi:hypothetical protein
MTDALAIFGLTVIFFYTIAAVREVIAGYRYGKRTLRRGPR